VPVLDEISAIGRGHCDDCLIIDDARRFLAAAPPALDMRQWPTIMEVLDALREHRPRHHLTILARSGDCRPAPRKAGGRPLWLVSRASVAAAAPSDDAASRVRHGASPLSRRLRSSYRPQRSVEHVSAFESHDVDSASGASRNRAVE
jgi:hypothetical protein